MIKYKFSMRLQGSNEQYEYVLDLQQDEEDNPDMVFTTKRREQLRDSLQKQSACKIDDTALSRIIRVWKQDIEVGCRYSSLTLDLPLLADAQIDDLAEEGNQEIPPLFKPDISGVEPQFGALPPLIFQ
jgi:hypothetical protein